MERGLTGTFHVAGERMSRHQFAIKVAQALGLDTALIQEGTMQEMRWAAKRPRDSFLDVTDTRRRLKTEFHNTEVALNFLKKELEIYKY